MAIKNLKNPSDEAISLYWRVYGSVIKAYGEGWHFPYSNDNDDEGLHEAYETAFNDAIAWLEKSA